MGASKKAASLLLVPTLALAALVAAALAASAPALPGRPADPPERGGTEPNASPLESPVPVAPGVDPTVVARPPHPGPTSAAASALPPAPAPSAPRSPVDDARLQPLNEDLPPQAPPNQNGPPKGDFKE